jgi:beta-lactamase regulating signal transducer with metallopeptidase domain
MAAIYATLFWCALQVTLFLTLAAPIYLVVRRRSPHAATFAAASSLAAVILLSALAASPWPRWSLATSDGGRVALADGSLATTDVGSDQAAPSSTNANVALSGDATPSAASPLAALWEAVQFAATPTPSAMTAGAPADEPGLRWTVIVVALFLVGMAVSGVHLVAGLVAVRRLITGSHPLEDATLIAELASLRQRLNIIRPVSLHESTEIATPATVGWRRPVILLPPMWQTWSDVERRSVLAHELAHISQHDFAAWLIARGAVVVHFYHPLVRWFASRLQLDQELAADAAAVRLLGDRQQYLHALANLALATPMHHIAGPARTFIPGRSLLVRRVEMLRTNSMPRSESRRRNRAARWTALSTLAVLALAIAGVRPESNAGEEHVSATSNELLRKVHLSGMVVDAQGTPVSSAIVVCPQYDINRTFVVTHTLPDGTFALEVTLPDGRRTPSFAWAYAEGHGIRTVNLNGVSNAMLTDLADLVLTLPAAEKSEFIVLDSDGNPLAGAVVGPWSVEMPNGVYSADEPTGLSGPIPNEIVNVIQRATDDEGRVSFDAVPAAILASVRVQTPEYGVQNFRPLKEELRLGPVGRIEGAIVSVNPERLEGLEFRISSDSHAGRQGVAIVKVDQQGRFDVPAIAAGQLAIRLAWPDGLPTQPEMKPLYPHLEAGQTLQLHLWERPAVILHGRVVAGEARVPVRRATVFVRHVRSPNFGQHVETDENGEFEAKTFSGETYLQVVSLGEDKAIAQAYDHPRIPNTSIADGIEEFQLDDIVLQPKAIFAGKLRRSDGSPGAGAAIGLRRGNDYRHLAGMATTSADGKFRMPVADWKLTEEFHPDVTNEWLLISQPDSPQETPTRTPLEVVSEEPLILQER